MMNWDDRLLILEKAVEALRLQFESISRQSAVTLTPDGTFRIKRTPAVNKMDEPTLGTTTVVANGTLASLNERLDNLMRENAKLRAELSAASPIGWRSITERPSPNKVVVVMRSKGATYPWTTYPFLAHTRPDGSWAILNPEESWYEAKFDEYDSSYKWMDIPQ